MRKKFVEIFDVIDGCIVTKYKINVGGTTIGRSISLKGWSCGDKNMIDIVNKDLDINFENNIVYIKGYYE